MKKKLDGNYTRMLPADLNKSWKQLSTKQQLYDHLLLISQTIQVKWARYAGHCWRSKDKLISNVHQWTTTHEHTSVGLAAKSYIYQPCVDIVCHLEDLARMIGIDAESQENLCYQHVLMIMMMTVRNYYYQVDDASHLGKNIKIA